jgi:hypothetical protein
MKAVKAKDLKVGQRVMLIRGSFIVAAEVRECYSGKDGMTGITVGSGAEPTADLWKISGRLRADEEVLLATEDEIMLVPDSSDEIPLAKSQSKSLKTPPASLHRNDPSSIAANRRIAQAIFALIPFSGPSFWRWADAWLRGERTQKDAEKMMREAVDMLRDLENCFERHLIREQWKSTEVAINLIVRAAFFLENDFDRISEKMVNSCISMALSEVRRILALKAENTINPEYWCLDAEEIESYLLMCKLAAKSCDRHVLFPELLPSE